MTGAWRIGALRLAAALLVSVALGGCGKEARRLGPTQPQTPPNGPADPRAAVFEGNALLLSTGNRYFVWYGCESCHGPAARGPLDLADGGWLNGNGIDAIYRSIASGHPGALARMGERIPPEQIWQLAAYVASLPGLDPGLRARRDTELAREPRSQAAGLTP